MIRFIVRCSVRNASAGYQETSYYTIDADIPELENTLARGGVSEDSHELHSLIGCEVRAVIGGSIGEEKADG